MNTSGVSMMELVVAVAIVSVGVAGVASLTATAARTLVHATALDEARVSLHSFVDSVMLNGVQAGSSGERTHHAGVLSWSVSAHAESPGWASFEHVALPARVRVDFAVRTTLDESGT